MTISLYDASVRGYIQTLGAVETLLHRGHAFCMDHSIDPQSIVEARLHPDMLHFRFQIRSTAHFSLGAIDALRSGVFRPPHDKTAYDYAGLQAIVADTLGVLKALVPSDINDFEGRDVVFEVGDRKLPFKAEDFLLSFSVPNLHFHATTAYDILRMKGVPLGKRDYLGALQLKG